MAMGYMGRSTPDPSRAAPRKPRGRPVKPRVAIRSALAETAERFESDELAHLALIARSSSSSVTISHGSSPGSCASAPPPTSSLAVSTLSGRSAGGGLPEVPLGSAGPPGALRRLSARRTRTRRGRARLGGPHPSVRGTKSASLWNSTSSPPTDRIRFAPRSSSGSRRDEPGLVGRDHGLGAVVHADLREDPLHVRLDRLEAHVQRAGDLTVRQAMSDEH